MLRRRYGQFLGEESTLFGDEDHDDHSKSEMRPGEKQDVLHEFGHAHDQAENATLFDDATKKVLRRALSAMWDAEKALRAIQPNGALPPENKALVAIKELQQSERIYLHKTAFNPPAIKEDKRMSGDMAGAASYQRAQDDAGESVPAPLRDLVGALATDGPLPALWTRTAHDWVRPASATSSVAMTSGQCARTGSAAVPAKRTMPLVASTAAPVASTAAPWKVA